MQIDLDTVFTLLTQYGYFILLPIAILEGPIVTVLAGYFVFLGYFNFWLVYLIAILGDLIGDVLLFSLGRWGLNAMSDRFKRFIGITPERLGRFQNLFARRSGETLLIGKLSHSAGFMVLIGAGVAKMKFSRFIWYNLLGTLPKTMLFLMLGFYFGTAIHNISGQLDRIFAVLFIILIVCALTFMGWHHYRLKKLKG